MPGRGAGAWRRSSSKAADRSCPSISTADQRRTSAPRPSYDKAGWSRSSPPARLGSRSGIAAGLRPRLAPCTSSTLQPANASASTRPPFVAQGEPALDSVDVDIDEHATTRARPPRPNASANEPNTTRRCRSLRCCSTVSKNSRESTSAISYTVDPGSVGQPASVVECVDEVPAGVAGVQRCGSRIAMSHSARSQSGGVGGLATNETVARICVCVRVPFPEDPRVSRKNKRCL